MNNTIALETTVVSRKFIAFRSPQVWLYSLIILHLIIWTLLPSLLRSNLPMDALEGYIWGHQLQWGYDRNPWLNGWLTRLAIDLGGTSGWLTYFFSQCCVVSAFWFVWQLGRRWLTPWYALVAVLLLEAVQYYSLAAVDFNDNVLELGLWPAFVFFGYQAIQSQSYKEWTRTGIIGALALMAKYYSLLLFAVYFLYLLTDQHARRSFKTPAFYIGVLLLIALSTPHFIWLWQHHFVTLHYAMDRVGDNEIFSWWHRISPALHFALCQPLNFLLAFLLFIASFLIKVKAKTEILTSPHVTFSSRYYLYLMGLGPYVLTVVLGLLSGWQLHTLWGTPLLSLWGLIVIVWLKPVLTKKRLCYLVTASFFMFFFYVSVYLFGVLAKDNHSSANYPAQQIAKDVEELWTARFQQPLRYVAGDRYLSGYISLYASSHPAVYLEWDPERSPWINEWQLRRYGAVFVQNEKDGEQFPLYVSLRYPQLIVLGMRSYVRPHGDALQQPVHVLIGFLPPQAFSDFH